MRPQIWRRYDEAGALPLGGYLFLVCVFTGAVAGAGALVVQVRGALDLGMLPGWKDLLLLGVAVHALTHMIARDRVLAPLRAPFTRFEKLAGAGELEEKVTARGVGQAVGQLITCPYCLGPWATLVLGTSLVIAPVAGRLACGGLAAVAISNVLHQLYARLRESSS